MNRHPYARPAVRDRAPWYVAVNERGVTPFEAAVLGVAFAALLAVLLHSAFVARTTTEYVPPADAICGTQAAPAACEVAP